MSQERSHDITVKGVKKKEKIQVPHLRIIAAVYQGDLKCVMEVLTIRTYKFVFFRGGVFLCRSRCFQQELRCILCEERPDPEDVLEKKSAGSGHSSDVCGYRTVTDRSM